MTTNPTYGQRLAQRLRERADRTGGVESNALAWQADLAEREWPLPVLCDYEAGVAWTAGDRIAVLCPQNAWEATQLFVGYREDADCILWPTPDQLRAALLWLVGLAGTPC